MTEQATWFGPSDRPLFGFVHGPDDGDIRGGVALCPPLGYEYICIHRTYRHLAERLAAHGFLVLRFDYDGIGDSAGDSFDPDRVTGWSTSISHAFGFLRTAGASAVGVVGMRMGATLASAVSGEECDGYVLWDPVLSGKAFLREQRTLQTVSLGASAETPARGSGLDLVGEEYTDETISALERCELQQPPHGAPVLALLRPDRPRQRLEKLLGGWSNVSVQAAVGQDRLLDGESSTALVPHQTVEVIVNWLDEAMPTKVVPVDLTEIRSLAELSVLGPPITERLFLFGSTKLFGIVSEQTVVDGRPTLVCLNNAVDHHIGPGRLWVNWGRLMAAQGWRVVRFDLAGIGDSPARMGEPIDRPYPAHAMSDIAEVCEEFGDDGVVLLGLCSGGINGLDAGSIVAARGVVAINSALHTPARFHSLMSPEMPNPPELVRLNNQRVLGRLHQLVPGPVWRALSATGRGPEKPRVLQALVAAGVDVLLVYGTDQYDLWKARQSMRWVLDSLARTSRLTVIKVPGLDHAAMAPGPRHALAEILTGHVTERFGHATKHKALSACTDSTSSEPAE